MKKFILIFFLLISYISVNGQDYLPMLEENTVWSIWNEKYTLVGDTVINDLTYKKLFYHKFLEEFTPDSLIYIAAMREDEINEKVYFIWEGFDTEVLLYDFSLEVGDVFNVYCPWFSISLHGPSFADYEIGTVFVCEVFYQNIAGVDRKTIKVAAYYSDYCDYIYFSEYWIEGIGSDSGLIYAGICSSVMMDYVYPNLICFHKNDSLIYQPPNPWGAFYEECYFEPTSSIVDLKETFLNIKAIPSFFRDSFVIQSDYPIEKVTVYNLMGSAILEFSSNESFSQKEIYTVNWDKGLYIIRAENQYGTAILKIIKY
jgi:hypothetical protein